MERPVMENQDQIRTREIRSSGIAGGPRETWLRWNCEPTSQSKERGLETLHLRARARALSRPHEHTGAEDLSVPSRAALASRAVAAKPERPRPVGSYAASH